MANNKFINLNNSIKVKYIGFADGNVIENAKVFITDNFIIVSDENGETEENPPTMYNINLVEFMKLY